MNDYLKITICCILILCSNVLKAQETLTLSLDSSIVYAIEHNKILISSKLTIDKSSQKIKETISQGLPQINASVDYNNFLGAEAEFKISEMAPPAVIEFNPTSNAKLSVSQLVFSGSYYVGIQLSKLAKTITEQSYQKDELNVKEQTIQAYYMILVSEKLLKIRLENKNNIQLIYEKTNNLANTGIIELTEPKKLLIIITSIDNAIKATERQVEMGYNLLRLQLGLSSEQEIKLTTDLEMLEQKFVTQSLMDDTFNIENNMDYKLISMQGDIAQKNIKLKRAAYLPTLAAYYSYTEKLIKPKFDLSPNQVVGLSLNIPIFSSGFRKYQVNQAKTDYYISLNNKELLTDQLTLQEKQLRYNYKNLYEQFQNQKANVEIAKEVFDKMNLKYEQGIVSSLELTSANNEYLNAESAYAGILLQLLNAELSLRKINSNF
ncbi:MAG TPA: TolC family protein [Flavobacterium sp.]|nr:TolC family protein [Flavobacterium sp.]HRZ74229.1 TolC family protein [Flavobacterium sp.]